jgi:hypothetical protein
MEMSANLLPRNRSNAASSIFGHAAFDFFSPAVFYARIAALIKAIDEQACKLSAIFGRDLRGFLLQLVDDFRHSGILRNLEKDGRHLKEVLVRARQSSNHSLSSSGGKAEGAEERRKRASRILG